MVRAGNLPDASVCPSAIECYHKSTIISYDVGSAPSGAFHWWDIGEYGHVAMATDNGWAMMASCHISESWGDCIGVTSVSAYTASTGAKYLGWSYDYSHSEIADVHKPNPPSPSVPRTATQDNGVPDSNYYKRQQIYVRTVHLWSSYSCFYFVLPFLSDSFDVVGLN
jgi:surface antigen